MYTCILTDRPKHNSKRRFQKLIFPVINRRSIFERLILQVIYQIAKFELVFLSSLEIRGVEG